MKKKPIFTGRLEFGWNYPHRGYYTVRASYSVERQQISSNSNRVLLISRDRRFRCHHRCYLDSDHKIVATDDIVNNEHRRRNAQHLFLRMIAIATSYIHYSHEQMICGKIQNYRHFSCAFRKTDVDDLSTQSTELIFHQAKKKKRKCIHTNLVQLSPLP